MASVRILQCMGGPGGHVHAHAQPCTPQRATRRTRQRVRAAAGGRAWGRCEAEAGSQLGVLEAARRGSGKEQLRGAWPRPPWPASPPKGRHARRRLKAAPTMSVVGPAETRILFAVLMVSAAIGQVLERSTQWGSRLSAPLMTMLMAMALSSLHVIPSASPAYDTVWGTLMPLAVALSLLETDVRKAFSDSGVTLTAFWFGAFGTVVGTTLAYCLVGTSLGPDGWKMAACLCASYIGGSINYAATARALGFGAGGVLAAGMAADNLLMAVYFGAIMALPEEWRFEEREEGEGEGEKKEADMGEAEAAASLISEEPQSPATVESMAAALAAAASACVLGDLLARSLPPALGGLELGAVALLASVLSALASALEGSSSHVRTFAGADTLAGALMLLFFAAVGASAGFTEAITAGGQLLAFGFILLGTHLGIILVLGRIYRLPMKAIIIASNANVGGPATAAAMAGARNWPKMVRPALLTGTLGYTIGTFIGCVVGTRLLQPMAASAFFLFKG